MTNNDNVFFDEKSGISIDEQKEILSQINGIAEKNKQSLSSGVINKNEKVAAKKNSAVFPLAVNAAAIIILLGGALSLFIINGKMDTQVRTGNAVYNLTERALIEEIRRDTADKIAEKESEMESISSRLVQIDDELLQLYSSNQELNAEQRAAQERLLAMQNTFREELAVLQDERSQILEASRSREANLRAVLDQRTREFAAAQQRASNDLESAMLELEKLTAEKDRIEALHALLSGGIAVINERGQGEQTDQFELMARNAQLLDKIDEMQKNIDALSSGGSGLTRRVSELQEQVSTLEQTTTERETKISQLETENTNFVSEVTRLRNDNVSKDQQIENLNTQVAAIRQLLLDNN